MAETMTRNARLADLAALAHEFLSAHTGLPDVAVVQVESYFAGEIRLHLAGPSTVMPVATWAVELGGTVRLVDHGSYVHVSTEIERHGHRIELWNHLRPVDAYKLLSPLGIEATASGEQVDPARLLGQPSTQDGAS